MKRLKVVTGHAAHARFLTELENDGDGMMLVLGTIPRHAEIPSPFAYSLTHNVYDWNGTPVIVVETRHARYEVFKVEEPVNPVEES